MRSKALAFHHVSASTVQRAAIIAATIACSLLLLGGCQPQQNTDPAGQASSSSGAEEGSGTWSIDGNCTACHATESESYENTACLVSQHADLECITCHADEEGLANAHKKATGAATSVRMKFTEVDEQACIGCHGSYEDLAEKTAQSTVLTDDDDTVVNPHEVKTLHNAAGQHDDVTCSNCHAMHDDEGTESHSQQLCLECHHQNVYECNTCH